MAHKTPLSDFRAHVSAGMADVLAFGAAFAVVTAAAALASWLAPWG
jgi:hypothetical protein